MGPLGPAVYGLTLASGHIRGGLVTHGDLAALHEETGAAVFLGCRPAITRVRRGSRERGGGVGHARWPDPSCAAPWRSSLVTACGRWSAH
jgi:hypothetical protein